MFNESSIENFSYLNEWEAKASISGQGISIPKGVKSDCKDILMNAGKIGFPLAVKLLNKDLLHKTDIGAVQLNVKNEMQLKKSVVTIQDNLKPYKDKYNSNFFLLEEMLPAPICELVVGIKRDRHFGLVLTLGSGGVFADLFKDYHLLLLPVHRDEIIQKIMTLKAGKLIEGYRGRAGSNLNMVVDCIERLIMFVLNSDTRIIEIEINPMFVFKEKVIVVDALLARED